MSILDDDVSFGVLALLAKNKFADEPIQVVLQLGCFVGTIDDPTVVGRVCIGLCSQLEAEVLDDVFIWLVHYPSRARVQNATYTMLVDLGIEQHC